MSMRDWAIDDYGLILDEETIKVIASKVFDDFTEDEDVFSVWGYELYEKGICEWISEFTGEAQELTDDGIFAWGGNEIAYHCDYIVYVPVFKYPTLFRRVYNDMDEIVDEFKSKLGKYLTEDFDYRSRIRHISGTYYG